MKKGCKKNVENLVKLKEKKQPMERFKGGFTYALLFGVSGESFRGGVGGGSKT